MYRFAAAFLCLLAAVPSASAQIFANPAHPSTAYADLTLTGDFNGDGRPDILLVSQNSTVVPPLTSQTNLLRLLLAQPDGTYQQSTTAPLQPQIITTRCQTGDFNKDGKLDVECVATDDNSTVTLTFYAGDGAGHLAAPAVSSFAAMSNSPGLSQAVDLNGDGNLDLVLTTDSTLMPLLGDSAGHFAVQPALSKFDSGAANVAIADLNGDGIPDLLDWGAGTGVGSTYLGNGDGTFRNFTTYVGLTNFTVADYDGDGHPDAIACTNGNLTFFHNNGDGTFNPTPAHTVDLTTYPGAPGVGVELVSVLRYADLNGDGIPDVLGAGQDGLTVLLGSGNLAFSAPLHYTIAPNTNAQTLFHDASAVTDMNGDGLPDIVSGDTFGVRIAYGAPDGSFKSGRIVESGAALASIAVADFNEDGIPDVVAGGDTSLHLHLGIGGGNFAPFAAIPGGSAYAPQPNAAAATVYASDFNGDKHQDLLVQAPTNEQGVTPVFLLPGHGDGTFSAPVQVASPPTGATPPVGIADINGDGIEDFLLANPQSGTLTFFLGQPSGTFQQSSMALPLTNGNGNSLPVFADVNHDGIPDMVYSDVQATHVLLGQGEAKFALAASLPAAVTSTTEGLHATALADVDGDGNLDILSTVALPGFPQSFQLYVYYGNGSGGFAPAAVIGSPLLNAIAPLSADVNGDGAQDILATNNWQFDFDTGSIGVEVLLGSKTRQFGGWDSYTTGSPTGMAAVADLNGDGRPDFLSTAADGNAFVVLLNLGNPPGLQTNLTAAPEPSAPGQEFTLTALLQPPGVTEPAITGPVAFTVAGKLVGTASLANGIARVTAPGMPIGTYALAASWPGNAQYAGLTLTGTHQVLGLSTSTTLTAQPNPAAVNQPVSLSAQVTAASGTPTGSVSFFNGATSLGTSPLSPGGTATLQTSFAATGTYPLNAQYSGDTTNQPGTSPVVNLVVQGSSSAFTIGLAAVPNPATVGAVVTFIAQLRPGSPVASATFVDTSNHNAVLGSASVGEANRITFQTSALSVGTHVVVAQPAGASASTSGLQSSNPLTEVILPAGFGPSGSLQLSATPASVTAYTGQTASLQAAVIPFGGFSGAVTLACSGLPAEAQCSVSPEPVTVAGHTAVAKLKVETTAPHQIAEAHTLREDAFATALAVLFPATLLLRCRKYRSLLLPLLLLVATLGILSGCGTSGPITGGTPPGTYTVTLTGQSGAEQASTQFTLTVKSYF